MRRWLRTYGGTAGRKREASVCSRTLLWLGGDSFALMAGSWGACPVNTPQERMRSLAAAASVREPTASVRGVFLAGLLSEIIWCDQKGPPPPTMAKLAEKPTRVRVKIHERNTNGCVLASTAQLALTHLRAASSLGSPGSLPHPVTFPLPFR